MTIEESIDFCKDWPDDWTDEDGLTEKGCIALGYTIIDVTQEELYALGKNIGDVVYFKDVKLLIQAATVLDENSTDWSDCYFCYLDDKHIFRFPDGVLHDICDCIPDYKTDNLAGECIVFIKQ